MKILMLQRFDIVNVGCAERIWRQAEELIARGHTITLVNFPHPERRKHLNNLRPEGPEGAELIGLDHRAIAFHHNRSILSEQIPHHDLIHLWKSYPDTALPLFWALRDCPKPIHYDWDDLEGGLGGVAHRMTHSRKVASLMAFWEKEILNWVETVTVASLELKQRCIGLGFPENRIFPGPVGASLSEVSPALVDGWRYRLNGKRVLLYIGQLEANDFPEAILDSLCSILRKFPDVHLVMVGDGSLRTHLAYQFGRLAMANRVLFTGYIPREEAQALLSLATLFLFPLQDDPMSRAKSPLVVIEAMARGIPIVASSVGEVPYMLGGFGTLVEGLDKTAWETALTHLLDHPDLCSQIGNDLRQRFSENFTWKHSVDHLEQAYHLALDRKS